MSDAGRLAAKPKQKKGRAAQEGDGAPFHIPVEPSAHLEWLPRVLKQGGTFAVFNPYGDIVTYQRPDEGLYFEDTRHLSHYELRMGNLRPVLLGSSVRRDNTIFTVDLTNPDFPRTDGAGVFPRDAVHISRSKFLWEGSCYERIKLHNYGTERVESVLQFTYDCDFADIFEVRGQKRRFRGHKLNTKIDDNGVILCYRGRDGIVRSTRLVFDPTPHSISPTSVTQIISLGPDENATIFVTVSCANKSNQQFSKDFLPCLRQARRDSRSKRANAALISTSNELFNEWLNRSLADLYSLVTDTDHGPYPYAGIPWFNAPFGRDGIITALQCLWLDPSMARGVLAYLAATQAMKTNAEQDATLGKILHETRQGEMANLGEVPFAQYYGSVDSTPLFVLLAGAYFERTGDRAFIERLWPNIEAALTWIDKYGDSDGDGFVEYFRQSSAGLANQGWKDSGDAIFHADGRLAEGPIALCEAQAYVYAAKRMAARIAAALGRDDQSQALAAQAKLLQRNFEKAFWSEDLSTYALALDGEKQPCLVRTSNAGHTLFCGIARDDRARRVAQTLMGIDFFSGWGIRTLSALEKRFNPVSYHNGSVWPHDNALIAMGFSRYGLRNELLKVLTGMFDTAIFMDLHRLPELFCGFARRPGESPILYPTACAPQAWSSAAASSLLAACLGLVFNCAKRQVHVDRPWLPPFLDSVQIRNLSLGDASVDLLFRRHANEVSVISTHRRGDVDIFITT